MHHDLDQRDGRHAHILAKAAPPMNDVLKLRHTLLYKSKAEASEVFNPEPKNTKYRSLQTTHRSQPSRVGARAWHNLPPSWDRWT